MEARAAMLAVAVLLAGVLVGSVFVWLERPLAGILLGALAVPLTLVVWLINERA